MPQPRPRRMWTASHGNTRSLTRWLKPGIEPTSSWISVGFVNHWATTGTPLSLIFEAWYYVLFSIPSLSLRVCVCVCVTIHIWKFPDQGLNPSLCSNQSRCNQILNPLCQSRNSFPPFSSLSVFQAILCWFFHLNFRSNLPHSEHKITYCYLFSTGQGAIRKWV